MSNPFSPTPIGKDWTPPLPPESTYADENALGDLFADAEPANTVSAEEHSTDGLGDLFADDAVSDDASAVHVADDITASGLGDLFSDDAGSVGAGAQPQTAPVPESTVVRPRVRKRGLVGVGNVAVPPVKKEAETHTADPASKNKAPETQTGPTPEPATEERVEAHVAADPGSQTTQITEAAASPVAAVAASTPAKTGTEAADDSSVPAAAPQRAALVDPAKRATIASTSRQERREERRSRNDQNTERIWHLVDQTLALIGTDSNLQRVTQDLELTQDLEIYRRQRSELESALRPRMGGAGIAIGGAGDIEKIIDRVHDELISISVLGELWRDPEVDEILVDRWDIINVERNGRLETTDLSFRDPRHAESTARALALKVSDRAVSRSIPLVTAELPGARITFAFGAVVKGGLSITIRKFKKLLELSDLLRFGSLNEEMVEFLSDAVKARASILVSGGTGTGKTTIINLLSTFIPDDERVITIEDAFELKLANTHVVSLQTKEASSSDDTVAVDLANLLRNTLRMRPDRIIVGEIREGAGAMVMLAAANTGHDGTITTIHANSVDAALNERLPDLVRQARSNRDDLAIQRSIAGAFDLAIQVSRGRAGGRYISEIALIRGIDETGAITTDSVFTGEEHGEGFTFERTPLRAETEFTRRLTERGGGRWTR